MSRRASAIVTAEIRVVESRQELRDASRRLRSTLSRPSSLAAAAALGALLGYLLTRRGRISAVAGALAMALIRGGVAKIIRRDAGNASSIGRSPSASARTASPIRGSAT